MSTVVDFSRVFADGEFQGASPRKKNNQPAYIDPHRLHMMAPELIIKG